MRVVIAHADRSIIKYLLVLWFLGASVLPVFGLFTTYHLDSNVLTITGYVGYFILGAFLMTVKMRRSLISILISVAVALTAIGTYMIAWSVGGGETYFFQQYLSPTMIFAAVMVFLLLLTFQTPANSTKATGQMLSTDSTSGSSSISQSSLVSGPFRGGYS